MDKQNLQEKYKKLWEKLPTDVAANLEFAKLVMLGEYHNQVYFFGDYSEPILRFICVKVFSSHKIEDAIITIKSEYYEFVAKPYDKKSHKPQWYLLKRYEGRNGLKLKGWLSNNSIHHFSRLKTKSDNEEKNKSELLDFMDYETLLSKDCYESEQSDEELVRNNRAKKAFEMLSEKDQDVINCLVLEKMHWTEAYERLNVYMKPRKGREVMETWSTKRKQDALAVLKARAIEHLQARYNNVK